MQHCYETCQSLYAFKNIKIFLANCFVNCRKPKLVTFDTFNFKICKHFGCFQYCHCSFNISLIIYVLVRVRKKFVLPTAQIFLGNFFSAFSVHQVWLKQVCNCLMSFTVVTVLVIQWRWVSWLCSFFVGLQRIMNLSSPSIDSVMCGIHA